MHRLRRIVALLLPLLLLSLLNSQAQIGGQVLETNTGKPIVGANISVPESSIGASSSRNGNFALQWYSFPIQLQVSAIGYEPQSITVFESTSELRIELESKVYLSDEITVSDARIDAQNIRTRPIPVTSVDVANNNFKQNTSSADLLRSEKGVYIQQTSPGQGSVYIRGRAGRDVLYLFNGLRMNPSFVRSGQNQYFGAVDPFTTRQINVFRGPVSVYYGSDALSGGLDVTPIIRSFSTDKSWSGAMVTQANFEGTGERTIHTNTSYTSPRLTFYLGGTARHYSYYRMSSSSKSDQWFPYETKINDVDYNFLSYTTSMRYRINERNQLSAVSYTGVIPDSPRLDRMVMGYRTQVDPSFTSPDVAYDSNTSPLMFSAHSVSLSSSVQRRFITSANIRLGYHQLKDHRKEVPYDTPPDLSTGFTEFTRSTVTRYDENTSDQYLFSFDALATPFKTTLVRLGGDINRDQISSRRYRTNPGESLREELPRYPDGSSYSQMGLFLHVNQNLSADLWVEGGVRFSYIQADLNLEGADSERGYDA
ncbi:MAG: TonB-dependent receptor [Balneolales bacterium]|nr:TonB-dependent receptor [Balneolales bacterium]